MIAFATIREIFAVALSMQIHLMQLVPLEVLAHFLNQPGYYRIAEYRKAMKISQREFADRLQLAGLDIDKNVIQRIECGKRFVTDIEIVFLANVLPADYSDLLSL